MVKCNECGRMVTPVDHNKRGYRCPECWTAIPDYTTEEKPAPPPEPVKEEKPKPTPRKRGRK